MVCNNAAIFPKRRYCINHIFNSLAIKQTPLCSYLELYSESINAHIVAFAFLQHLYLTRI